MLFVYLSSNTQLHEIFKLPALFEHYLEHHQSNASLSFFDFLKMHYADNNIIYPDYEEDMKLPFKSTDVCDYFVAIFSMLPNHPTIKEPLHTQETMFAEFKHQFICTSVLNAIWQPPKKA